MAGGLTMQAPQVVLVSSYYPPHLGGQEVVVQDLAQRLHGSEVSVEVVTSDLGSARGVTLDKGVRVTRLKSFEFAHTAVIWGLFAWLVKHIKRDTVVHVHAGQIFTPEIVWLASRIARFKYILHFHSDMKPSGVMGKLLPIYNRVFLVPAVRDAAIIVVLRNDRKFELMQEYPNNRGIIVMSNGITDEFFDVPREPGRSSGRLLFVGRLSPHKNVAGLLDALATRESKFGLDIVGDGESREELEAFVAERQLTNVTFHGKVNRDELHQFYSSCSAFVLPSFYEQQAMVLLEAMACRVPIIASRVNVSDTTNGSVIFVDPTTEGIISGIAEFAGMSMEEVDEMVDSAYQKVRRLSWSAVIDSYVDLYSEVVAGLAVGIGPRDCPRAESASGPRPGRR
jgi:glycosyltransferase involved in cell wall biosynthesis